MNIDYLRHLAVFTQTQGEADLCRAPSGSGDLAAIQETAKNRLGMNYPAADQTVYLDVSLSGGDAGGGRATAQAIASSA